MTKRGLIRLADLTVDENLQILMPGGTLVLGGTIQTGNTADIQADTVIRKDGERTDVKADDSDPDQSWIWNGKQPGSAWKPEMADFQPLR